MKNKKQPSQLKSGDYLYQACMAGLSHDAKRWAIEQVKFFEDMGYAIPYGLIRQEALKISNAKLK